MPDQKDCTKNTLYFYAEIEHLTLQTPDECVSKYQVVLLIARGVLWNRGYENVMYVKTLKGDEYQEQAAASFFLDFEG